MNDKNEPPRMETVVCIPLSLEGQQDFLRQVISVTDGKYMFAGLLLMSVEDKVSIRCEICQSDPAIGEAFEIGGQGAISSEELTEIAAHRSVLYLVWDQPGLSELHRLHAFIKVCLKCGGLGVKFENSGVAHSKNTWLSMKFHENTLELMQTHIMLIGDENYYYSSGMHIFGLPDTAVPVSIDNRQAGYLLTEFNHYQIFESPDFQDGQTFSTDADAPYYRLQVKNDWIYADLECFENPYGRILLEPV